MYTMNCPRDEDVSLPRIPHVSIIVEILHLFFLRIILRLIWLRGIPVSPRSLQVCFPLHFFPLQIFSLILSPRRLHTCLTLGSLAMALIFSPSLRKLYTYLTLGSQGNGAYLVDESERVTHLPNPGFTRQWRSSCGRV